MVLARLRVKVRAPPNLNPTLMALSRARTTLPLFRLTSILVSRSPLKLKLRSMLKSKLRPSEAERLLGERMLRVSRGVPSQGE